MSVIISCQGITKHVASKTLFEDITFGINEGDHVGIIGANGSGKTTFLKILAGAEQPDAGELTRRKFAKITYVAQQDSFDPAMTVKAAMQMSLVANDVPADSVELTAARMLNQLTFDNDQQLVGELSGGWRKRLAIGCGLAVEPDLLLLDEPTNHLDLASVMWLEGILKRLKCAWVLVSHDRMFLEHTATKMVEINKIYNQNMLIADGKYSDLLAKREEYRASQVAYAASLSNKVRREIEWLQRGPKARTSKSKSRIDQAGDLQLELANVKSNLRTSDTQLEFTGTGRKTKKLIELKDVSATIGGRELFSELSLVISPKSRIAIVGPNGSGKSTLMQSVIRNKSPHSGTVAHADDLKLHYFEQDRAHLDETVTLKQALGQGSDSVVYNGRQVHIVSWAKRFQFDTRQLDTTVSQLSGGEKARVRIAQLMLTDADVLMLDEPTNDLDIPTLETLEESLQEFPGAVIIISHDRYLLERICDQFVGLDGLGHSGVFASLDQCLKMRSKPVKPSGEDQQSSAAPTTAKTRRKKKKLSYLEQRELDTMEDAILAAEQDLSDAEKLAADPKFATDAAKLLDLQNDLDKAQKKVELLYQRWARLSEKQNEQD